MVQSDPSGSTGSARRLSRQQARIGATVLLALVLSPVGAAGLRHQSAWLGGGTACSGPSPEAVLCKRDAWISGQPIPTGGVPEVIHQAWFPATKPLPLKYAEWQQTWVTNHPGWQLWLWSDVTNRLLVSRCCLPPLLALLGSQQSCCEPRQGLHAESWLHFAGTIHGCSSSMTACPTRSCAVTSCGQCICTGAPNTAPLHLLAIAEPVRFPASLLKGRQNALLWCASCNPGSSSSIKQQHAATPRP